MFTENRFQSAAALTNTDAMLASLESRFHSGHSPVRLVPFTQRVVPEPQPFVSPWRQSLQESAAKAKVSLSRRPKPRMPRSEPVRRETASPKKVYQPAGMNPLQWKTCKCGTIIRTKAQHCKQCWLRAIAPLEIICPCGRACNPRSRIGKCKECRVVKRVCAHCPEELPKKFQGRFCAGCRLKRQQELGAANQLKLAARLYPNPKRRKVCACGRLCNRENASGVCQPCKRAAALTKEAA